VVTRAVDAGRSSSWAPSLRRSVALLAAFRLEQSDPEHFYTRLATDSVGQVAQYATLEGSLVLDVGGGPGYFRDAFAAAGARYLAIDADVGELAARGEPEPGQVLGSGLDLPISSDVVDICYSSNVVEHVAQPERLVTEMLRVTRPGGIVFVSYTVWWSPWGGHETAPWHYLGGRYAASRYRRRHGREPKNRYGVSLFPVTAGQMIRWTAHRVDADVVDVLPRYHPRWAQWLVQVPLLRELTVWNLVVVMRKR
jgi:SAM-dependent methyltransferase